MTSRATFNQWVAGILTILSLLGVIAVIFLKSNGDQSSKTVAITALCGALSAGIILFLKAGSDAQHSDQIKQMTDGLINSTPVKP